MRFPIVLLLPVAGVLLAGCAEGTYLNDYGYWHRGPRLWNWGDWNGVSQEPIVIYVPVYPRPPHPPKVSPPEPTYRAFSAASALAGIHAVDLAPCTARGAPRAYGHAQITFLPDGNASKVRVDAPEGMSPDAVACVGESLGAARAPAFDGAPMTVGASYYMR